MEIEIDDYVTRLKKPDGRDGPRENSVKEESLAVQRTSSFLLSLEWSGWSGGGCCFELCCYEFLFSYFLVLHLIYFSHSHSISMFVPFP